MKKLILMSLVLCGAIIASADDSYLYWMVADSVKSMYDYDTASLSAFLKSDGSLAGDVDFADKTAAGSGVWSNLGGSSYASDAYTFAIELFNSDGNFLAWSPIGDYTSIQNILKSSVSAQTSPLVANAFAIPEPTSGLMLLVGVALLGLRRRKA